MLIPLLCSLALGADGVVLDADTRTPIVGARVSVQASDNVTTTDSSGAFTLAVTGSQLQFVGSAHGWFNGGVVADGGGTFEILLDRLPLDAGVTYTPMAPTECAVCHPSQYASWSTSAMAAADTNTWVYDLYDGTGTPAGDGGFVYKRDSEHAIENPESECGACHQPEVWMTDPWTGMDVSLAAHGVSCESCHLVFNVDEENANYPGLYPDIVQLVRPADGAPTRIQLGKLDSTFSSARMRGGFQPEMGALLCAACHQDRSDPDGDGDFEEANGPISEPTYWEWRDSPYGDPTDPLHQTCVDCHMPITGASSASAVSSVDRTGSIRNHDIRGTTPEFLDDAASVGLELSQEQGELVVDVTVTNDAVGHHFPTGVTVRNVILLVEAFAGGTALEHVGDQVVHDLGGVGDVSEGYYAGQPGRIYAKYIVDADGNGPTFFTDAAEIVFDTRIPATESDRATFRFAVPDVGGTVEVRAKLIYRRAYRALVDAKGWTADGHGDTLADLQAPHFGHLVTEVTSSLETTATEDEKSCGCSSTGATGLLWLGLPLLALARRRR